jgi:hypothetical protein
MSLALPSRGIHWHLRGSHAHRSSYTSTSIPFPAIPTESCCQAREHTSDDASFDAGPSALPEWGSSLSLQDREGQELKFEGEQKNHHQVTAHSAMRLLTNQHHQHIRILPWSPAPSSPYSLVSSDMFLVFQWIFRTNHSHTFHLTQQCNTQLGIRPLHSLLCSVSHSPSLWGLLSLLLTESLYRVSLVQSRYAVLFVRSLALGYILRYPFHVFWLLS